MNEPLNVRPRTGFWATAGAWLPDILVPGTVTFYQTSYTELDDGRFASFFTVAQDNGRLLKYIGLIVLPAGVIIMYIGMIRRRKRTKPTTTSPAPTALPDLIYLPHLLLPKALYHAAPPFISLRHDHVLCTQPAVHTNKRRGNHPSGT